MGYVTITTTERTGDSLSRSESIHFECVEDFLKYKEYKELQSTDEVVDADSIPDSNGWIAWDGRYEDGPVGILSDTKVEVHLRDGTEWTGADAEMCSGWYWKHEQGDADIVAYRIYKGE